MIKIYLLLLFVCSVLAGLAPWPSDKAHAGIIMTPPFADATADVIEGHAQVIDGDTIEIGHRQIKLAGIDAMELHQTCHRYGTEWSCGEHAKAWLEHFINQREVRCIRVGAEGFGPIAANCYNAANIPLAWAMVHWGLAIDDRMYLPSFARSERAAIAGKRGIWSGDFVKPVVWRRDGI